MDMVSIDTPYGLSPRVRGKPRQLIGPVLRRRSIPACAGEAVSAAMSSAAETVYPRVCGGSWTQTAAARMYLGLSPRVRGKPARQFNRYRHSGSIPACAGEAQVKLQRVDAAAVYPRVCGGSPPAPPTRRQPSGLSPRVRGKPPLPPTGCCAPRSIPACAGEARQGREEIGDAEVYPRVCGGSDRAFFPAGPGAGLSPRVRGKPMVRSTPGAKPWSIPACAGEATTSGEGSPTYKVYPRVCGGSRFGKEPVLFDEGLSPRVRGKPDPQVAREEFNRSIPACAGEAMFLSPVYALASVYPRVCGGSRRPMEGVTDYQGLSPRVRGKLAELYGGQAHWGSIPACAGEAPGW